jgi:hypothetical protein
MPLRWLQIFVSTPFASKPTNVKLDSRSFLRDSLNFELVAISLPHSGIERALDSGPGVGPRRSVGMHSGIRGSSPTTSIWPGDLVRPE